MRVREVSWVILASSPGFTEPLTPKLRAIISLTRKVRTLTMASAYLASTAGAYIADRYYKSNVSLLGGEMRNKGTAKRTVLEDGSASVSRSSRLLYTERLVQIPRTDGTTVQEEINARQRDICYVAGAKICFQFCNENVGVADVAEVNMALLTPRCGNTVSGTDFFRSSELERSRDFDSTLSSMEFNCLPINSDEYNVIWRKRFKVLPQVAQSNGKWMKSVKMYIPIKRQFRFDNNATTTDCPSPFIVYWVDKQCSDGGTISAPSVVRLTKRIVTYFREPK